MLTHSSSTFRNRVLVGQLITVMLTQTKVKTLTILAAYLTSRYFTLADNIWGKTSRCLSWHLPHVFAYYCLPANWLPFIADTIKDVWLQVLFQRSQLVGWELSVALGVSQHLPPPGTIPCHPGDSLTHSGAWGDVEKFCNSVFLLISPKWVIRRSGIWACHSVGTPLPSLHPYSGWGSEETCLTHHFWWKLGLCFCAVQWRCPTCSSP